MFEIDVQNIRSTMQIARFGGKLKCLVATVSLASKAVASYEQVKKHDPSIHPSSADISRMEHDKIKKTFF